MNNKELEQYLTNNILPVYDKFDKGHDRRHVHEVLKYAKDICNILEYDKTDLIDTAVYYHDIGLLQGRDLHHRYSYKYVLEDKELHKFFLSKEIEYIASMCLEHRTSAKKSCIESRILADADKLDSLLNVNRMFERSILYTIEHCNYNNVDELFSIVHGHLRDKYGKDGYMKLSISSIELAYRRDKIKINETLFDITKSRNIFDNIANTIPNIFS